MSVTSIQQPPEFIKLLAHELRWRLLKVLSVGDYRVHELVAFVSQPMNLVSYHLKRLRTDGLVTTRRSESDGRDIYYSLDLKRFRELYLDAAKALHPALAMEIPIATPYPAIRVLFVCTHNSARSQMAEALFKDISDGQIEVVSAGSEPTNVHPLAVETMAKLGIDMQLQQSRSLHDFVTHPFDYVITVCDRAREVCPTFPGEGVQLHWGFPDPIAVTDEQERRLAFEKTAQALKARIENFIFTLPGA